MATSIPLSADPITVTGGSVQVELNISDARIRLTGDHFLVQTGTESFFVPNPSGPFWPFPAGSVNLSGVWIGLTPQGGEAIFNGVHYPRVVFESPTGGTFVAPSVTLTGEGLQTLSVPFTFNGSVTAFANFTRPPEELPLFTTTLVGRGMATAAFFGREGLFHPVSLPGADFQLEYVFLPSTPVPEPGTLVLFGAGALGMLAARRRRASKR
jgi:hypothetical protein